MFSLDWWRHVTLQEGGCRFVLVQSSNSLSWPTSNTPHLLLGSRCYWSRKWSVNHAGLKLCASPGALATPRAVGVLNRKVKYSLNLVRLGNDGFFKRLLVYPHWQWPFMTSQVISQWRHQMNLKLTIYYDVTNSCSIRHQMNPFWRHNLTIVTSFSDYLFLVSFSIYNKLVYLIIFSYSNSLSIPNKSCTIFRFYYFLF